MARLGEEKELLSLQLDDKHSRITAKKKSMNLTSVAGSDRPPVRKTNASLNVSVEAHKQFRRPYEFSVPHGINDRQQKSRAKTLKPPIPNTWGSNPTGPFDNGRTVSKSVSRDHPYSLSKRENIAKKRKRSKKATVESHRRMADHFGTGARISPEDEFDRLNEEITRRARQDETISNDDADQGEKEQDEKMVRESIDQISQSQHRDLATDASAKMSLHSRPSEERESAELSTALAPLKPLYTEEIGPTHGSTDVSDDESSESDLFEVDTSTYKASDFTLKLTESTLHRSGPSIVGREELKETLRDSPSPLELPQHKDRVIYEVDEASSFTTQELMVSESRHSLGDEPEPSVPTSFFSDGSMIERWNSSSPISSGSTSLSSLIGQILSQRRIQLSGETSVHADDNQVEKVETLDGQSTPEMEPSYLPEKPNNEYEQEEEASSSPNEHTVTVNQSINTMHSFLWPEAERSLKHVSLPYLLHEITYQVVGTCGFNLLTKNWEADPGAYDRVFSLKRNGLLPINLLMKNLINPIVRMSENERWTILGHVDTRCNLLLLHPTSCSESNWIKSAELLNMADAMWIQAFQVLLPSYKALKDSVCPVSQSSDEPISTSLDVSIELHNPVLPILNNRPEKSYSYGSVIHDFLKIMLPPELIKYISYPTIAPLTHQSQVRQYHSGTPIPQLLPDVINVTIVLLLGRRLAQFFYFGIDNKKPLFQDEDSTPFDGRPASHILS